MARRVMSVLAPHLSSAGPGIGLRFADGEMPAVGGDDVAATIVINSRRGLTALVSMDATRIAEAYRAGALDVEGSMERVLTLRAAFADRHPITSAWKSLRPRLFGQVSSDKKWIADHYEREAGFYLMFLDRRHRCYSQARFASPDESIEDAQTRKLDTAVDALGLPAGSRVLDVGGGWGAFTEHGGRRGLHVTSLTLSQDQFVSRLIAEQGLPCRVIREHLMEHTTTERYDGIVNLGTTEHLPDYPATLRKYAQLLKPGGRVYLDACATREPQEHSAFLLRHVFPGNGTTLCLHTYLEAVAASPFDLVSVHNDTEHYRLTALHWAKNLDAHRDEIQRRWGAEEFRTFRLYLWGAVDAFTHDRVQAYRWVLQLPAR
jgi:cyclopropane-fatty-acyl-phospholipid synthase